MKNVWTEDRKTTDEKGKIKRKVGNWEVEENMGVNEDEKQWRGRRGNDAAEKKNDNEQLWEKPSGQHRLNRDYNLDLCINDQFVGMKSITHHPCLWIVCFTSLRQIS